MKNTLAKKLKQVPEGYLIIGVDLTFPRLIGQWQLESSRYFQRIPWV
jgi:hypothetical protein